jgi:transposase InsO family protein
MKTMTAEEVVKHFFNLVIAPHGCTENLISDNGTQFLSSAFQAILKAYHIKRAEVSSYHHQTLGKVERFIRFFKQGLVVVTPENKRSTWDEYIDHILFVYRTSVFRVLSDSPFFMLYGRDPTLPRDLAFNINPNRRAIEETNYETNYQFLSQRFKELYD